MFHSAAMNQIIEKHHPLLADLSEVENQLNRRFYDMEDTVRALILAVACGEPLLLIGSPGTAKSMLIREFCRILGFKVHNKSEVRKGESIEVENEDYFEYLLTPFTEPGELFGMVDVQQLTKQKGYQRIENGMMHRARVVYLDEVFNASSAILNSILAVMNEGIFHDFGKVKHVKMECMFAATNTLKLTPELRAFADRFVLRCWVDNIEAEKQHLGQLLDKGWAETYASEGVKAKPALLHELKGFREFIGLLSTSGELKPDGKHEILGSICQIVHELRNHHYSEMSNRRLVKMSRIMLIHAVYRAVIEKKITRPEVAEPELDLIYKYFVDRQDRDLTIMNNHVRMDWKQLKSKTPS